MQNQHKKTADHIYHMLIILYTKNIFSYIMYEKKNYIIYEKIIYIIIHEKPTEAFLYTRNFRLTIK